jgi:hypothetical protein
MFYGRWTTLLWAAVAAFLAEPYVVYAHESRPLIATIVLTKNGTFELQISLDLESYLAGTSAEHLEKPDPVQVNRYEQLRRLQAPELRATFNVSSEDFLEAVRLEFDGDRPELVVGQIRVPPLTGTELPRTSTVFLTGTVPPGARSMTWVLDPDLGASVIRARYSDEEALLHSAYLAAGAASAPVQLKGTSAQSGWTVFTNYLLVGFEHIVPKGLDHILFVVGLFLLSMQWKILLWQVTSFAVAHTVSLALGVTGVVQVSPGVVEPLIAASIVYVALENLATDRLTPWRPLVVFAFGLLHGLGFAGVLGEIGLASGHFATGLIAFNVGVELGQLAVIAACFATIGLWARGKTWYRRAVAMPASAVVGLLGAYWFVERVT